MRPHSKLVGYETSSLQTEQVRVWGCEAAGCATVTGADRELIAGPNIRFCQGH